MIELERLQTEQRNPRTKNIDCLPTLDVVRLLNAEDKTVPLAIEKILPQIAEAADLIADHLAAGGRLFYQGAGTSGRLGILDAVECPPTYRTDPSRIVGLIAGGTPAIFRAQEGAEDQESLGAEDLRKHDFSAEDVLVGIAASGRTPYVLGGLHYARSLGAAAIALTCSKNSPAAAAADLALELSVDRNGGVFNLSQYCSHDRFLSMPQRGGVLVPTAVGSAGQRGYSLLEENTPFVSPQRRTRGDPSTPDIAGLILE